MSRICIYLKLPSYLDEWVRHNFGEPAVFPRHSCQNAVIRTFLRRLPPGELPDLGAEGLTAVAIPDSVGKPVEVWNHLGPTGKQAVVESIQDLFSRSLWSDISPLIRPRLNLSVMIAAWCERNGISEDGVEAVRQRYYRLRKDFAKRGVNICHKKGEK